MRTVPDGVSLWVKGPYLFIADSVLSAVSGPVFGFHDFHQLFHICREEMLVCTAQICFLYSSFGKVLPVSLAAPAAQLPYAADLAFFGKAHRFLYDLLRGSYQFSVDTVALYNLKIRLIICSRGRNRRQERNIGYTACLFQRLVVFQLIRQRNDIDRLARIERRTHRPDNQLM